MQGHEHYREAERLLLSCQLLPANAAESATYPTYPDREDGLDSCTNALAAAQVHATLALAAAMSSPVPAPVDLAALADLDIGARVRTLRKHTGATQSSLAEQMTNRGVSWHQSTVAKVEAGRPLLLREAVALADVLSVPITHLIADQPES